MKSVFGLDGTVGPLPYLASGLLAFLVKYTIDRVAAAMLLHRPWRPWEYLNPVGTTASLLSLGRPDREFLLVMSAIALPFIWFGVSLTVRRLRALRAPAGLVILFFVPLVNLLFFMLLSLIPARNAAPDEVYRGWGRAHEAALALAISLPVCLGGVWLATRLPSYGLGLFIALPYCLGLISVLIYTWRTPRSYGECVTVAILACSVVAAALILLAFDGVICLLMAAPIALALAILGATLGYGIQHHTFSARELTAVLLLLAIFPPATMASESLSSLPVPEFTVRTTIEVNAPPGVVWRHVVSFSPLPAPEDWLFRAGIAYPIRAEIEGRGPGAVRQCIFSTGAFIEPITIWDEPRLLEFSVTRNPAPMREWTPYAGVHPPPLNEHLVSR